MKITLVAATLAAMIVSAQAAPPDDAYLVAREAAIAKLNPNGDPGDITDAKSKQEAAARSALEKQLRTVVGAVAIKGFTGQGKLNLESLFKGDMGFGSLDALKFTSGKKTQLFVTNRPIFERWVKDHKDWWDNKVENIPQDPRTALKSEAFYTQAISSGAAAFSYGNLPVSKPDGADAVNAMLTSWRQDIGPGAPDDVVVSVLTPSRLFIVTTPVAAKIKLMPVCETFWTDAMEKSESLSKAYRDGGLKDDKLLDQQSKTQEQGDIAMRKCFAEKLPSDAAFQRLVKQAQDIVDQLAAR